MSDIVSSETKTCIRCHETKPLSEFYTSNRKCKLCCSQYVKERTQRLKQQRLLVPLFDIPQSKTCRVCHEIKPIEQFKKDPGIIDGYAYICKPCRNAAEMIRKVNWPHRQASTHVSGMDILTVTKLLEAQGNVCAACKEPEKRVNHHTKLPKRLSLDHDHATGKIRGILCSDCNMALGLLQDDPARVEALLKYIQKYTAQK